MSVPTQAIYQLSRDKARGTVLGRSFDEDVDAVLSAWCEGGGRQNRIGLQARFDRLAPVALDATVQRQSTGMLRADRVRQGSVAVFGNTAQWLDKFHSVAGTRGWMPTASTSRATYRPTAGGCGTISAYPSWRWCSGRGCRGSISCVRAGVSTATMRGERGRAPTRESARRGHGHAAGGCARAEVGLRSEVVPGLQTSLALWRLGIGSELQFVGNMGETLASRPTRRQCIEWTNHYRAAPWLEL